MRSSMWLGGIRCVAVLGVAAAAFNCVGSDDSVIVDAGKDTSTGSDTSVPDTSTTDGPGQDAPDPCGTAPTTTFYVNPTTGADSNTGAGPNCAFKSITAALAATNDSAHANATLNLAAGTYGASETFPLIINHGRSLVGAGAANTKIQGSSAAAYKTTNTGSPFDAATSFFVTVVAGDVIGGTDNYTAATLSGVTILPASSITTPTTNYIGAACIAGNGPNTGTTTPLPAANLVLKSVTIGPNFDTALLIGSMPTQQSACNVLVTTSTFTGSNVGITTGTCGTTNPSLVWPSAQIGDGQVPNANTFTATGIGVFLEGCGSVQSIYTNKFVSGFRGIVAVSQAAQYVEILGNTFDGATAPNMGMGLNTNSSAIIKKLNDNTFTNISENAAADTAVGATTGYAISLGGGNVFQALRNTIANNDNGIYVGGTLNASFDFSSDGMTANRNQIYCNAKSLSGKGYDVILAESSGSAANFTGNQWDNNSPTTSVSLTTSANGTDIVTGTSGGATTTTSLAGITTACSAGRVH